MITENAFVLSVIRGGYRIDIAEPIPNGVIRLRPPALPALHRQHISQEVSLLLQKGAIETVRDHPSLCDTQALGEVACDSQYEGDQHVHSHRTLPNGDSCVHLAHTGGRGLGDLARSNGCLLPYTDSPCISGSVGVCVSRPNLSVSSFALRASPSPESLHSDSFGSGSFPSGSRPSLVHLPRRLVVGGEFRAKAPCPVELSAPHNSESGLPSELGKVGVISHSHPHLFWVWR